MTCDNTDELHFMGNENHGAACNGEATDDFQHLSSSLRRYCHTLAYKQWIGSIVTNLRRPQASEVDPPKMTDNKLDFRRRQISKGLFSCWPLSLSTYA
jgi:hypothetical protein